MHSILNNYNFLHLQKFFSYYCVLFNVQKHSGSVKLYTIFFRIENSFQYFFLQTGYILCFSASLFNYYSDKNYCNETEEIYLKTKFLHTLHSLFLAHSMYNLFTIFLILILLILNKI